MRRASVPVARALALGSACIALACSSAEPRAFDVRVAVTTGDGEPVPGAEVRLRSGPAVTTNAVGAATLRLPGQAGDRLPVSLACPPGFRASPGEIELVLPAAALELACDIEARDAVVLVHASGAAASLPVKVDGVVVGQTDSLGFAHVHVHASPAAMFEVSLDTSTNASLSPANPARRFQIGPADELYVFETTFTTQKPGRRPRRAANQRRVPPSGVD